MKLGAVVASATAGERDRTFEKRFFDLSLCIPINSLNSNETVDVVACARDLALLSAPASLYSPASTPASPAGVAHARSTPMHDAHNSLSDTVRVQGLTGRRCTKGGVSSRAEDLFPVSKVEARVNFRPAGGVRGQVAGSIPRGQLNTGTKLVREGAVTPSLHPEVPVGGAINTMMMTQSGPHALVPRAGGRIIRS